MTTLLHTGRPTPSAPVRQRWINRVLLRVLKIRRRVPSGGGTLVALRYTARDARTITLPVQAAVDGDRFTVLVGEAASKSWWRHFRTGATVEVLVGGCWRSGYGLVNDSDAAAAAYRRGFPRARIGTIPVLVTVDLFETPVAPLRGRRLIRSWTLRVTAAEFVGFAVPAVVGALTARAAASVSVPALLAAGAVEGAMLGWGQAAVLRRAIPAIAAARWIALTAAAAVAAYTIGLIPSTFAGVRDSWPPAALAATGLVLGVPLLGSIGTAQWLVLRHHVDRAYRWIGATAVAWLLGLGVFLSFAMPLWQPGQSVAVVAGIGVVAGLLMAATSSTVTGFALDRLLGPTADERPAARSAR